MSTTETDRATTRPSVQSGREEREDVSVVHDGLELNPRDESPPNAEVRGVWKVLGSSTALAVAAMVIIGVIAAMLF